MSMPTDHKDRLVEVRVKADTDCWPNSFIMHITCVLHVRSAHDIWCQHFKVNITVPCLSPLSNQSGIFNDLICIHASHQVSNSSSSCVVHVWMILGPFTRGGWLSLGDVGVGPGGGPGVGFIDRHIQEVPDEDSIVVWAADDLELVELEPEHAAWMLLQ